MTTCRTGSRAARAARTATVLPAPTSPVITPRACSVTVQVIRTTASLWAAWRCSMAGARSRPNGSRVKPQWPCSFCSISGHHLLWRSGACRTGGSAGRPWLAGRRPVRRGRRCGGGRRAGGSRPAGRRSRSWWPGLVCGSPVGLLVDVRGVGGGSEQGGVVDPGFQLLGVVGVDQPQVVNPGRWRVSLGLFGSGFGVGVPADAERHGFAVAAAAVADLDVGQVEWVEHQLGLAADEQLVDLVAVV